MRAFLVYITMMASFVGQQPATAQQQAVIPDLSKINDPETWTINHWSVENREGIHINKKLGHELVYLKNLLFSNGIIEVEIKGGDEAGKNFMGIAFHIQNDTTYELVYFRPFNFKHEIRKNHSVQYVSHPGFPWDKLRAEHPGMYENSVTPVPDPNDWFHTTIKVSFPLVQVFINHSKDPSLTIEQLSNRQQGSIGFWVPDKSEGSFRNLKITPADK